MLNDNRIGIERIIKSTALKKWHANQINKDLYSCLVKILADESSVVELHSLCLKEDVTEIEIPCSGDVVVGFHLSNGVPSGTYALKLVPYFKGMGIEQNQGDETTLLLEPDMSYPFFTNLTGVPQGHSKLKISFPKMSHLHVIYGCTPHVLRRILSISNPPLRHQSHRLK